MKRFVYGPVPSRRLGRSLGIDLVPYKICSYDCVYCQLGRTTNKTTELKEYVPVKQVLDEVAERLRVGPRPDYIGLAGSGEPTLHARLGDIVAGVKRLTNIPVAVLTNGSLLWKPEVRAALEDADLVLPSLDAGSPTAFHRVNRPHLEVSFERMIDGLVTFSNEYRGKVWLEVFVVGGITDQAVEISRIAAIVEKMRPDRVQLNTVSRPPTEANARAVPADVLENLCGFFASPCEVIAASHSARPAHSAVSADIEDDIVALLSRRPCTIEGVATGLGLHPNEVLKYLERLSVKGTIVSERRGDEVFYERAGNR